MAKKAAPKKERAINLDDMFSAVNQMNYKWFSELSAEGQKEFSPFVVCRYLSNATRDKESSAILTNDFVNYGSNMLNKHHKELQWMSMVAALGTGVNTRYRFVPPPRVGKKDKFVQELASRNEMWSLDEAQIVSDGMTSQEKKDFLSKCGYNAKEIKEFKV